jgi:hypothetical protein
MLALLCEHLSGGVREYEHWQSHEKLKVEYKAPVPLRFAVGKMNKTYLPFIRFVSCCLFVILLGLPAIGQGSKMTSETAPMEDADQDNPEARDQWFRRGREPLPGHTSAELRYRAHQQKVTLRVMRSLRATAVSGAAPLASMGDWIPLGPAPLASNAGTGQDYGAVSGRANAVVIDPADSTGNTVYVGGAFGGLWRSTNAATTNAAAVTWTPLTDDQPTLSFGAIALQPGNVTGNRSNVIIVGTGEANAAIDSYYGLGFLRSTDGGSTWNLITTANNGALSLQGLAVSRMAFSTLTPNTVVAAIATSPIGVENGADTSSSTRGIYTSINAGASWIDENLLDGTTIVDPTSATSVVFNAAAGRFYAAIRYHGFYSSADGVTWTRLANQPGTLLTPAACPPTPFSSSCPMYRGEIAVVPGRNEMYAWYMSFDSTGRIVDQGIYRTTNGGSTAWNKISETGLTNCGDSGPSCGPAQGFFNMTLAAVPSGTATDLYAGAVNEVKCPSLVANSLTCGGSAAGWLNLTHVYGCSPPGSIALVHPDQHDNDFMIVGGKALMYFANDGGIYRALDGFSGLTTGTCGGSNAFSNLNGTLGSMTQFVSFSQHPSNAAILLGGTQDNGSPATSQATTNASWINVNAGDGGFNEINPASTNEWFTANTDVSIQRCTSGIACTAPTFPLVVTNSTVAGDHGAFYTPYILDPQSATSELLVGTCRVWRGMGTGGSYTALSNNFETGTATTCSGNETNLVRAIAAGGPKLSGLSNVVYATTDGFGPLQPSSPAGGRVFRTLNAVGGPATWIDVTQNINPNQYTVSSVAIDTSDASGQTAYVALMGFGTSHVFKTTNAGSTWADFSGSGLGALPSAPANTLVIDATAGAIFVGTDVGVFASATNAASWTEVGPNAVPGASGYLPNVPVTKLRLFNSGGQKILRASTYGRGIWQYNLAAVPDYIIGISNSPRTTFPSQAVAFNGVLTALNGYTSPVNLTCTSATTPPPATCTPAPTSVAPIPAGSSFTVSAGGNIGDYSFNVHAVGSDANSITHDQGVTLHVVDFDLTTPNPSSVSVNRPSTSNQTSFQVTSQGSFNQPISLTCSGLPNGASCNFSPSSASPTAGNPVTVSVTIGTTASTPAGTYTITVAGNTTNPAGSRTQTLTLVVTTNADFSITATGGSQTTTVNQSLALNGKLTAINGYSRAVTLSCTGTPPATCTASPSSVVPTTSGAAFSITVRSSTTGTFNFSITGSDSQGTTHSVPVSLTVVSDFTVSPSSGTQSVLAGQAANYSFSLAPVGSSTFGSNVAYSCSGLPAGAACNFNPASISAGSGSTTVALTISTLGPNAIAPPRSTRVLALLLVSVLGIVIGGMWRSNRPKRHSSMVVLSLLIASILLLPSCGGGMSGGGSPPPPPAVSVTVSPASASVFPSAPQKTVTQQFTATVHNTTNTQITWQVNGVAGGNSIFGQISNTGVYTAPATVPSPTSFNVTAVSQADPTKSASAVLTVQAPTPTGTYNVTITATSGGVVHTTTAVLVVQ